MLLLEHLTVSTGNGRKLEGVDLVVRRGERHGAVATDPRVRAAVIELLLGRRRPDRGRVRVDGLDPVCDAELLAGRIHLAGHPGGDLPAAPAADVLLLEAAAGVTDVLDDLPPAGRRAAPRTPVTVLLLTDDPVLAERHCDRVSRLR